MKKRENKSLKNKDVLSQESINEFQQLPIRKKPKAKWPKNLLFVSVVIVLVGIAVGLIFALSNTTFNIVIDKTVANGQIVASENLENINPGSKVSFTIIPDEGYEIDTILVDGKEIEITSESGEEQVYVFEEVNSNHTISATFTIRSFVLGSGDVVGGTVTPESIVKKYGESQEFTITPHLGYKIISIVIDKGTPSQQIVKVTAKEGEGQKYEFKKIQKNSTITATFAIRTFTVQFRDHDGTVLKVNGQDSQIVNYGAKAIAPVEPIRESTEQQTYIFDGWDKSYNSVESNLVITAQYKESVRKYTVSFQDWDKEEIDSMLVEYGSAVTVPEDPSREATAQYTYEFAGWDIEIPETVTGDITFVATYSSIVNEYTVTFKDWDGEVLQVNGQDSQLIKYGSAATAPANPEREGYRFTGWSASHSFITEDTEIEAQFIQQFKVSIIQSENGIISPSTLDLDKGSSQTFTITPNEQYYLLEIIVDGVVIPVENTGEIEYYTLENISEDYTLSATFIAAGPFEFNESKAISGYIGGDGLVELSETEENTFTLIEDAEILLPEVCLTYYNTNWFYKSSELSDPVKLTARKTSLSGIYMVTYTIPHESEGWTYVKDFNERYYIAGVPEGSGTLIIPHKLDTASYGVIDIYGLANSLIGHGQITNIANYSNVIIEEGILDMGAHVFQDCTNLKSIVIPRGVEYIGPNTFARCTSLTSITIPNTVKEIYEYAFGECISLTSIAIPNSVTSFEGIQIFDGCLNLVAINVSSSNLNYSSLNGVLFNKNQTTLVCYPMGKTETFYKIPNSVTSIGNRAFQNCSKLISITIPNSVRSIDAFAFEATGLISVVIPASLTEYIGTSAFARCLSLSSITFESATPPQSGLLPSIFDGSVNIETVYVPKGSVEAYVEALASGWITHKILEIP